ncbi:MAG: hypothetical protein INQ03_09615 [Candidatus Heimdallarchaeota archaeon]|nr:hypothetical protein [Candidatus Heimdallarchaeota archaeon]
MSDVEEKTTFDIDGEEFIEDPTIEEFIEDFVQKTISLYDLLVLKIINYKINYNNQNQHILDHFL